MNIDTFIERLAVATDGWHVTGCGGIRDGEGRCPIVAVMNPNCGWDGRLHAYDANQSTKRPERLSTTDLYDIRYAADMCSHGNDDLMTPHRCEIRRRMLEALGLEELCLR